MVKNHPSAARISDSAAAASAIPYFAGKNFASQSVTTVRTRVFSSANMK
jgi:hypothetical protein